MSDQAASMTPVSDRFAPGLLDELRRLGDEYGPLGVALAAAYQTDPKVLIKSLTPFCGVPGCRVPECHGPVNGPSGS